MANDINFHNTKIAFGHKSDAELRKAYWLFRLVSSPALVKFGKVATNLALTLRLPIKGLVKKTIFAQFVGGETAQEADDNTDVLSDYGIGTILDYSVEGKHSPEGFEETTEEIIKTVHISAGVESVPFCVFKLSGIGRFGLLEKRSAGGSFSVEEEKEWAIFEGRADRICKIAFESGTPVMIDAEESWIQPAADAMVERLMMTYNRERPIVHHTLQMYRHDRLSYLIKLKAQSKKENWHLGVKIVRGAYMEKERERAEENGYPDPIQATREDTHRDYDDAIRFIVDHLDGSSLVCGTHNEDSSYLLTRLIAEKGVEKNDPRLWFAQLFGMSDHISYNLAAAGYNVAKYVPYGPVKEVLPYLIRRAEENTSAAGQTGRELGLIENEMKRRKN